jgi:hypothetical protein
MTQHMPIRAGAERQQGHRRRLVRSPFAWTHLARGTLVLKLGAMIRNRTPEIKSDFHDGRMIAFRARQRVVLRLVLRVVLLRGWLPHTQRILLPMESILDCHGLEQASFRQRCR